MPARPVGPPAAEGAMRTGTAGFALVLAGLLLAGCDGGNEATDVTDPGKGFRVAGRVGPGFQVAAARDGLVQRLAAWVGLGAPVLADGGQPVVDRVVALRVNRGSLSTASLIEGEEAVVDADGTFVLELGRDSDWILVLADSRAEGAARYVGAVELAAEEIPDDSLLAVPVTTAEVDRMDLGTLARVAAVGPTVDAVADTEVAPQDFGLTVGELLAMARTDDVFRNARNIVANHDRDTGTWYGITTAFAWRNDAPVAPDFTSPLASTFDGYGFQVDTNSTAVTIDNLCGTAAPRVTVGLFPPTDVVAVQPHGATYGPEKGMTNDEVGDCTVRNGIVQASDVDFFGSVGMEGSGRTVSYGFSQVAFGTPIPAGDWTWREDGQVRATFDLALAAPIVEGGLQGGFVPSIRVAAADDGRVTGIDVRWSYWDPSAGAYVEVASLDGAVVARSLGKPEIGIYEPERDTETVEKRMFDAEALTTIVPADPWYLGVEPPTDGKRVGHVILYFETGGIARTVLFTGFPNPE